MGISPPAQSSGPLKSLVRLSIKALTYGASLCTPLGPISGLHKGIIGLLGGSYGILVTGGVEDDAGLLSGGNYDWGIKV